METYPWYWWAAFNLFVVIMLALDLGVFHKKNEAVKLSGALKWTGIWIGLAMVFNGFVYYQLGNAKALEFFTGYLIEKSLSVDNIFVMLMIFGYFQVPKEYQHKVLFWGIFGALIFRIIFIVAGIELIHHFHFLIYAFGAFLIFTGAKMILAGDLKLEPEKNPIVKLVHRLFPTTTAYHADKFFVRLDGRLWATPLFVAVAMIEATDLVFAVDSIPAILAISDDPFIVYTSNVFAILGLRSLYFVLAEADSQFAYLKFGLAAILVFVGTKMCIVDLYKIPIEISLIVIVGVLMVSMAASLVLRPRITPPAPSPERGDQ
jgi:tellurite resistance protein TerC